MLILLQFIVLWYFVIDFNVYSYKVKQVLILSRHNIRAPFKDNLVKLHLESWQDSSIEPDDITPQGAKQEENIGVQLWKIFKDYNFITDECPAEEFVYIRANNTPRTITTAKIFTNAIFKNCNIPVHVSKNSLFKTIVRNNSEEFKFKAISSVQTALKNLNLSRHYHFLNNILNFNQSETCLKNNICLLSEVDGNKFYFKVGEELNIIGPLFEAVRIVDTIVMLYYNGKSLEDLLLHDYDHKKIFSTIKEIWKAFYHVRFGNRMVARDASLPLLKFIANTFVNEKPKFTLLFGHDSNIRALLSSLQFKPFDVLNELEPIPVGGKLIFKKLYDEKTSSDVLQVNFIYETTDDLKRNSVKYQEGKLQSVQLELEECETDEHGYCPWEDFVKIVVNTLHG